MCSEELQMRTTKSMYWFTLEYKEYVINTVESNCDSSDDEKDLKKLICSQWIKWMLQTLPFTVLLETDKSIKASDVLRNVESYNRLAEYTRGLLTFLAIETAVER